MMYNLYTYLENNCNSMERQIILSRIEGKTFREIASDLGVCVGTVTKINHSVVNNLRKCKRKHYNLIEDMICVEAEQFEVSEMVMNRVFDVKDCKEGIENSDCFISMNKSFRWYALNVMYSEFCFRRFDYLMSVVFKNKISKDNLRFNVVLWSVRTRKQEIKNHLELALRVTDIVAEDNKRRMLESEQRQGKC